MNTYNIGQKVFIVSKEPIGGSLQVRRATVDHHKVDTGKVTTFVKIPGNKEPSNGSHYVFFDKQADAIEYAIKKTS